MKITIRNKTYKWDYWVLIRNLFHIGAMVYLLWAYFYLSNSDYLTTKGIF